MLLDGLRPSDQGPLRGTTPGVFASAGAGWRCGGGGVGLGGGRDLAIPSRHVRQLCEWGHHQPSREPPKLVELHQFKELFQPSFLVTSQPLWFGEHSFNHLPRLVPIAANTRPHEFFAGAGARTMCRDDVGDNGRELIDNLHDKPLSMFTIRALTAELARGSSGTLGRDERCARYSKVARISGSRPATLSVAGTAHTGHPWPPCGSARHRIRCDMMRKQICRDHVFALHLEAPTSTAGDGIIEASKGGSLRATVHQDPALRFLACLRDCCDMSIEKI